MKIGYVGLGKLGLPVALSAARWHDVVGYDPAPQAAEALASRVYPHREERAQEYLESTTLRAVGSVDDVVRHADVVFVLVQTPHLEDFEGVTRLPDERADFDYSYLKTAVSQVAAAAEARGGRRLVLSVMSTVLPGTIEREIKPLLNRRTALVYNPAFPAMGTAIPDFEAPEFVLLGVEDQDAADAVREFYQFVRAPVVEMSVASAEATKVFYNSFITAKIDLANAWMEICHRLGADVDDVSRALSLATARVLSPKYMRGGMGDAGGCHPRDNIALSWLSRSLGMGYDLFGDLMRVRERQAEWLAGLCVARAAGRPVVVLGKAYKSGTNLTVGSCATLLKNILAESVSDVQQFDPHVDPPRTFDSPAVFVVATDHAVFYDESTTYPKGSLVVDPWGRMADRDGVEVVRVGRTGPRAGVRGAPRPAAKTT